MSNQIKTVPFHGQQVSILNQHNKPYVEMRSIVENIGLDWGAQLKRIKRNHILNSTMVIMTTVAQDGKSREITCLPLSMLNGWLLGIDTNRVKPELREKLERYQLECFDVLFEYWTTGEVKKKTKTTVDQRTPLRDAVNLLVSKKAITYSEAYSIVHQRFNVASIEDLPQDQLPQAIEYVHKVALEGEYIPHQKETLITMSIDEFYDLAWVCNAARYMYKRVVLITPALTAIESDYSSVFKTMGFEYKSNVQKGIDIILAKTKQLSLSNAILNGRYFPNLEKTI